MICPELAKGRLTPGGSLADDASRSDATPKVASPPTSWSMRSWPVAGRLPAAATCGLGAGGGVGMLLGLWGYFRGPVTEADVDEQLQCAP